MAPTGRRTIDLEPFKDTIHAWILEKKSYQTIAELLKLPPFRVNVGIRTLQEHGRNWGWGRAKRRTIDDAAVAIIKERFHFSFDSDEAIAEHLNEAGFIGSAAEVRAVRQREGWLRRRPASGPAHEAEQARVTAAVEEKLAEGTVRQYGARFMQTALRQDGVVASRASVLAAQHAVDAEGVAFRSKGWKSRTMGIYRTAGPNWLWSVDGHLKLAPWDIEIYACVDTYSRRVVWIYVNPSAMTQVAVVRQFLRTVKELDKFPRRIRADRGSETTMMFDAQYALYRQWALDSGAAESASELDTKRFRLANCALYGTSTKNVKIEGFWNQLQKRHLSAWRVCRLFDVIEVMLTSDNRSTFSTCKRKAGGPMQQQIELLHCIFCCQLFGGRSSSSCSTGTGTISESSVIGLALLQAGLTICISSHRVEHQTMPAHHPHQSYQHSSLKQTCMVSCRRLTAGQRQYYTMPFFPAHLLLF